MEKLLRYIKNLEEALSEEGYDLEELGRSEQVKKYINFLMDTVIKEEGNAVALALFEFDTEGTIEEIKNCVNRQIINDRNVYWQNSDDTAQMTRVNTIAFYPHP